VINWCFRDGVWIAPILVPPEQVVFLQSLLETYEGLATVRTVDVETSTVVLICSDSGKQDVQALLESLSGRVKWSAGEL
jgi:hypothetical protein